MGEVPLRGPIRIEVLPGKLVNWRKDLTFRQRVLGPPFMRDHYRFKNLAEHHWHVFPEPPR